MQNNINKNVCSHKTKTICYIISYIILFLATLTGCLVNIFAKESFEAIINSDITTENRIAEGLDLFESKTSINPFVFADLCRKMSNGKDYLKNNQNIQRTTASNGLGYILTMAGLDWQVVYRSKDYVTLWLADSYKNIDNSLFTTYYKNNVPFQAYSQLPIENTIRHSLINVIYPSNFGPYQSIADEIIATPNDIYREGVIWQASEIETVWWGGYKSRNSNLGAEGIGTAAYDKLWIPSATELCNGDNNFPGLWGLSERELCFESVSKSCLLRSGCEYVNYSDRVFILNGSGSLGYGGDVTDIRAVRPALHLNLTNIINYANFSLKFNNGNFTASPSTEIAMNANTSKEIILQGMNDNLIISIQDQWNNNINIDGIGSNKNYSYSAKYNKENGEVIITFSNVSNHLQFTVNTIKTIEITNKNSSIIKIISSTRATNTTTSAKIIAEFDNNYLPSISIMYGNIEIFKNLGNGVLDTISYIYTFKEQILTIDFYGITNGIFAVSFDVVKDKNYVIDIVTHNSQIAITYDVNGDTELTVRPDNGYWVNSFTIEGQTYCVDHITKNIIGINNVFMLSYAASSYSNIFIMNFKMLGGNIEIIINCSNIPLSDLKEGGGTTINGVAISTTEGGDAKIVANTIYDEGSTQSTVNLVAWINAGYSFAGWSTDGGKTYLADALGNRYGASASIPAELVKGMVVTACFSKNTNKNVNNELNNSNFL